MPNRHASRASSGAAGPRAGRPAGCRAVRWVRGAARALGASAALVAALVSFGCSRGGGGAEPIAPQSPTGPAPIAVPGTTYWVDADIGNDANDGLTHGTAFRSLGRAVQALSPDGGDRLFVVGSFRETLVLAKLNNPDAGSPNPQRPTVVQCGFDAEGNPLAAVIDGGIAGPGYFPFDQRGLPPGFGPGEGGYLDRGIAVNDCNYVTLSGLVVRGIAGTGVLGWRSSHLRCEAMTVEWTALSAMHLANGNRNDPTVADITVAHCRINQSNLGLWQNRATGSGYNMKSETLSIVQVDGFSVYNNHISNSLMEGIDFKFGSRNGAIHNNLVENTRAVGIYCNEGEDSRIFRNIVRCVGWFDPQDGSGLQLAAPLLSARLGGQPVQEHGASGILVSNGDLNPYEAYESGRSSGIDIYENVISWTRNAAVIVWNEWRVEGKSGWQLDRIRIYNNVTHAACKAPGIITFAIQVDVGVTNTLVANNIVASSGRPGFGIWDSGVLPFASSNQVSTNLFWDNQGGEVWGTAPLFADPRFRQPSPQAGVPGDFQLQPGSPAIDVGLPLGLTTGGTPTDLGAYQAGLPPWSAGLQP